MSKKKQSGVTAAQSELATTCGDYKRANLPILLDELVASKAVDVQEKDGGVVLTALGRSTKPAATAVIALENWCAAVRRDVLREQKVAAVA